MTILIAPINNEIQARCNALNNDSTLDDVRDLAIAAKIVELAGGSLNKIVLSEQIQRMINLSGAGSEIENLIALASALIKAPEAIDPLPIGILAPFVEQDIHFTDSNFREWLKTGYISTDVASYPDALRSYIPGNTSVANAIPNSSAVLYHSASNLWLCASSTAAYSSPDHITWTNRGNFNITKMIELPTGKVIGVSGSSTYHHTDDGINWLAKTGQNAGFSKIVPTINGYWYGCNSTQTGWAKDAGTITVVPVASGTAWQDIAYSPELNRLVMVGTNLCQTNDAAFAGSWTTRTIPAGVYASVVWFPEAKMFIAVATSGAWSTSPDGINWIAREMFGVAVTDLFYDKFTRTVFGSGAAGTFVYTRDGHTWVSVGAGTASGKMTSKFGEGILIGGSGRFSPYTPVVGVETASRLSSSAPHYVRIK
ncbi:hypothetical protein [Cellvibrio mixtus]|uniref:hypothetical protein n=1 Tax=Cellvibrio mixtus TaxID=39650 RepID=UPI000587D619|nr:hypothetical protein [Cellvibrio mixtus]